MHKFRLRIVEKLENARKKVSNLLTELVKPQNISPSPNSLMEQMNFNALLLTGLLFSLIMCVFSIIELDILSNICTIIFAFIFSYLYYLSRYKNYQNVWMIVIVVLITLSISWFVYGGTIGSTAYLYILFLFFIIIIAKRHQHYSIFFIFISNIIILYFLEQYYGKYIVHNYLSKKEYYADLIFTFFVVLISTFFIMRFLKRMFDEERRKVENQKEIIEIQNKEHRDSLIYAANMQQKINSNRNQLGLLVSDYFVLFKPKDIVSGDFYWVKAKGEIGIVVVADCTGHGIPAAFLSILGITLLEETCKQLKEEYTASEVLEKLREKFLAHFQKNENLSEQTKDGIDLGICIINYRESNFQFSGANRMLMLLRANSIDSPEDYSDKSSTENYSLYTYNATKNTIGFNYTQLPFINHVIDFYPNDSFYLFSDGYSDQFDHTNKKKFKLGQLKNKLLKIQDLTMMTQEEYLDELHKSWKGSTEQTDDILIVGMRI